MRPMAAGQNGAVYLTLENGTDANAWVVGARTVVARSVEFHRTQIDGDIARMRPLDSLDIPADGQAILEPAGAHMMLIDLAQDFAAGDIFPVTLKLAAGQEIVVPVRVQMEAGN
jgi:copper(I)-binding protein